MNEKIGLELIKEMKNETEKFFEGGSKSYQLLQEYFGGLSRETLRELLCNQDKRIKLNALWILTELEGDDARDLMKEVVPHMNDDDPLICYYAMYIVAYDSGEEYIDDFMRVFTFLEHTNPKVRYLVMYLISCLPGSRIYEACGYSDNTNILSDSHKKGLLSLSDAHAYSEIMYMINSDDDIIRKYGIIAASRLYEKYPEIINEAVNADDLDVREFSRGQIKAADATAQYHRSRRKL